jgi:hypothetical protein
MSGYVIKSKAHREKCYSLQAGETPLAFPRRLGGRLHRAYRRPIDDPAIGGSAPISRVDSGAAPSALGDKGTAGSHLS